MRHDPMLAILADLMRRVDGIASERGHVSVVRLHDEVDQIRHIARAFHLDAVEGLAGTLESTRSWPGGAVLSRPDARCDRDGKTGRHHDAARRPPRADHRAARLNARR